jgi:hypothetical protein
MSELPLIPFDEIQSMAAVVAKAGCFGFKSPEQAAALMLVAQADGLHPAKAATHYHIIQGKPSLTADAMLARFQQAGGKVCWEAYGDDLVCGTFTHPLGGTVSITWNIARAKKAGVGNLEKYPAAMLRARCISEGVRTVFPGVIVGLYTPEEVSTFDAVPQKITYVADAQTTVVDLPQVPESITSATTLQELVKAFQQAVAGAHPDSEFYKVCQQAAATKKASL